MRTANQYNSHSTAITIRRKIAELTDELSTSQLQSLLVYAERHLDDHNPLSRSSTPLSKRETEVILLLSKGYSRREIGRCLRITSNTAAKHISNIYQKLDITTVAEATRYVLHNEGSITQVL